MYSFFYAMDTSLAFIRMSESCSVRRICANTGLHLYFYLHASEIVDSMKIAILQFQTSLYFNLCYIY